jgi:hypothetical protein
MIETQKRGHSKPLSLKSLFQKQSMLEKDYLVNEELMYFLSNNLILTSRDNLIEINLNTNTFDKINQINNI